MKAVCPNNPEHNRFITTAHEVHDWVVDRNGDFLEDLCCVETGHGPDPHNDWTCEICGAKARIE